MSAIRGAIYGAAVMAAVSALAGLSQARVYYPDDPIRIEPITQDVVRAKDYEPDIYYDYLVNYAHHPGDPATGQRARNVNTVDEVPDGPFFVNRAGRIPLTPEMVARAANTDDGPAPGPWTVISAKTQGVSTGFTMRDSQGTTWYLKFDPPGWLGMATGSEIIGAKLYWALGYHVPEYHIVRFQPSVLTVSDRAEIKLPGERKRRMRMRDIDRLLAPLDRQPDGSYRAIASKALPGTYVGRLRYDGTRKDDPNDIIPHEHRRELRGYKVFAAWLNNVDVWPGQSRVTVITEDGRTYLRTYLIDFGSILGSAGSKPREFWHGHDREVEGPGRIAERAVSFGLLVPHWRVMPFYQASAVGRLPQSEHEWDPEDWEPLVSNAAFHHARADDKFWAAYKLTFINENMVRAAVAEAQFPDAVAAEHVVRDIMARRARILETYLPAVNPLVEPALGNDGVLRFRNAAVDFTRAPEPRGYRASWSAFDNETGRTTFIAVTESDGTAVPSPPLPPAGYLEVELSSVGAPRASWEQPLMLHFRRTNGSWELVGLHRM